MQTGSPEVQTQACMNLFVCLFVVFDCVLVLVREPACLSRTRCLVPVHMLRLAPGLRGKLKFLVVLDSVVCMLDVLWQPVCCKYSLP